MYGIDHPLIPQTTQRTIGNRTSGDEGARVCWGCDRDGIPLREVSSEGTRLIGVARVVDLPHQQVGWG